MLHNWFSQLSLFFASVGNSNGFEVGISHSQISGKLVNSTRMCLTVSGSKQHQSFTEAAEQHYKATSNGWPSEATDTCYVTGTYENRRTFEHVTMMPSLKRKCRTASQWCINVLTISPVWMLHTLNQFITGGVTTTTSTHINTTTIITTVHF